MSSFILDGFVDGFTNGYVGEDKIYLNLHMFKNALNKYFLQTLQEIKVSSVNENTKRIQ